MKNIAVIFAGGVGSRMQNTHVPKQFLEIGKKPIILHTIEKFQQCDEIDSIIIACHKDYVVELQQRLDLNKVSKVEWIVPGGATSQLSIFNALETLKRDLRVDKDAIVLIHDGVRPAIDEKLILENINVARNKGNAITVFPATETIFISKDKISINNILKREEIYYARAPQTFYLREIFSIHLLEKSNGIIDNIDSCSMMFKHGHKLNLIIGSSINIKITTNEDFFMYKGIYELEKLGNI